MKKLIFLLFLIPVFASAQKTTGTNYTYIAQRYEWLAGVFKALGLPAGDSPAFQTGQEQRAGAVYYDSTGGDAGLYIWDGVAWVLQGGSVTPTFQQVLTAGSILTGNNTVNGGGFNFYLSNHRLFNINSVSVTGDTAATFEFNPDIGQSIISMSDLTNTTSFTFRPESSAILSPLISLTTDNLYFNGSLPSAAITDSVLTWDAVSKQVRVVARADIGGGGSQDLNDVALIGNVSTVGLRSNTAIEVLDTITGAGVAMDKLGYISVTNTSIKAGRISATLLTDDRYFELPDTSGTFALLSDIVDGGGDAFLANNQTFTGENTFSNATNKFTGLPITDTTEGYVAIKADGTLVKAMKVVVDTNAFFAPNQTSGGNTSHDGNNFDFLFTNAKDINFIANENFNIDALSFLGLTAATQINAISPDITWQANNVLALIAADSFNISTPTGVITIDTLQQSTDTTANKPTVWNTTTEAFTVLDHWPGSGGGGANTALSNLASVAVNTSLISDTDVTDDLGSSSISWRDIFANVLKAGNGTISLPSISFKNSTNTGLWYTSTSGGAINLSLNGVRLGYLNFAPSGSANGQGNTFLGYNAGTNNWASAGTGGLNNTFIGGESGQNNDLGQQNTFIGSRTGFENTSGSQNTAIGQGSFFQNLTSSSNSGLGFHAGLNVLGANNTFVGTESGEGASGATAAGNSALGRLALTAITTGFNNVAIGLSNSSGLTTGNWNTTIGSYVAPVSNTGAGQLNIGNVIYGTGLYQTASISSAPTTLGSIGIGLTTPTARLHLPAGTATANTAPFKFTSGTNLSVIENGAMEYDGTNLYVSIGGVRKQLNDQAGTTFVTLSDGPGAFTGQAAKSVRVNAGETALEYYTTTSGGTGSNLSYDAANREVDIDGGGTSATLPLALDDGATEGLASFTAADFTTTAGNVAIDYANGQAASASVPGFVTTGTQTLAGNKTLSGFSFLTGGFASSTSSAASNFYVFGGNAVGSLSTTAGYLVEGATGTMARFAGLGTTATTMSVNYNGTNFAMAQQSFTEAASGTHPLVAGMILRAPSVTGGAGATTNLATLYIDGAPGGITPTSESNSIWVASGNTRFGKAGTATGTVSFEGATSGKVILTPAAAAGTPTLTLGTTTGILAGTLTNTGTLDFGSTVAGASTDLTLTVTGAADGDAVSIGVPNGSTLSNGIFTAWVSAANTVTLRFSNNSLAATLDPASGTFRASVIKY